MVYLQSAIKRGYLRQLTEGAKRVSTTLRNALILAQGQIFTDSFKTGRVIVSTSGNGQSASFNVPTFGATQVSQEQIFALYEELIALHDDVVTAGTDAADHDALFAAMVADPLLQGSRSAIGDFTGLNFPTFGGVPAS